MLARLFTYHVISRIVGVLLLLAALLKFHEFLTVEYRDLSLLTLVFAAVEALFALWLLFGFLPDWSRLATLLLFLVFANVTFSQALAESPTCGCLGLLPIRPWIVFAADVVIFALILFARRPQQVPRIGRRETMAYSGVAAAVVIVCLLSAAGRLLPWGTSEDPQSASAQRLLAAVTDGIHKNHSAYGALEFRLKEVTINPAVKTETKTVRKNKEGTVTAIIYAKPRVEQEFRYTLQGANLRRETVSGLTPRTVHTVFRGCQLHYDPRGNRALALDAEGPMAGQPHDPRCFGFDTPLLSVGDWLQRNQLTSVSPYEDAEDEGIDVQATVTFVPATVPVSRRWVVRFSAGYNYLPVHLDEYYDNGNLSRHGEFTYMRLPDDSAWFLKRLRIERWGTKAQDKPFAIIEYEVDMPIVKARVPDAVFDLPLPKGVNVATGTKKVSVARLNAAKSFFDLFVDPAETAAQTRRMYWPYVLLLDSALLVAGFFLQRYVRI